MAILDQGLQAPVRSPGVTNPKLFAFRGTTAANGDITLAAGSDYDGAFTAPTRSTNTYTITVGSFRYLLGFELRHSLGATIDVSLGTIDAAAGTIQFTTSATWNAANFSCLLVLDRGAE